MILYPHARKQLGYPEFATVTAITLACILEFAIAAGPGVPPEVTTLKDFFAWCKVNPSKANFGSPGAGSVPQLIGTLVGRAAGIALKHRDFGSTRAMLRGVTTGEVSVGSAPIGDFMGEMKAGKVRLLGISGNIRAIVSCRTFRRMSNKA